MENKKWTIIGYWGDNQQPWCSHAEGATLEEAYINVYEELRYHGEDPNGIWIVGAFHGEVMEISGLDNATRLDDLLEKAVVVCSLCHKNTPATTAHLHQNQWIGECCWDNRLHASE